jgi:hypothetical protein
VSNSITAFAFMQVDGADRRAQNRGYKAGRIRFVPLASNAHRLLALHVMRVVSNSITAFALSLLAALPSGSSLYLFCTFG